MNRGGTLGIDTETTGLDTLRDRVLYWSMATDQDRYCFPVNMLQFFEPLFQREDITWALANAKYDMHLLANSGTELVGPKHCIIVMDAMVDDTRPHGLKEQSWMSYEADWGEFKQLFLDSQFVADVLGLDKVAYREFKKLGTGDKLEKMYSISPSTVTEYASCDAFFTLLRWNDLRDELASEELATEVAPGFDTLWDYFTVIEEPMTQCLWDMERTGVLVDREYAKSIDGPMRNGLRALEQEIYTLAGTKFNVNSPQQLQSVLYSDKGFDLNAVRYTKGKKASKTPTASTDEKTLDILSQKHIGTPVGKFIIKLQEHRKLKKLHGTYVAKIISGELLGPDGRIHTNYNQAGARTSRLSSSKPNVQNIPRADPSSDPYLIRGMFVAPDGYDLLDKDYPQIEFRVAAVMADEEAMMEDIRKGWDIHNANTSAMFGIPYDAVAAAKAKHKDELTQADREILGKRHQAKTVGLGTMYGEGAVKMAVQLGITKDRAYDLKDTFFDTRPNIEALVKWMHRFAHDNGFTYTMLGRKRRLHNIQNTDNRGYISQEERRAFNTLIQGSAAELIKLAMLRIHFDKEFQQTGSRLSLSVHDELLGEAPKGEAAEAADRRMQKLMCKPLHWGPIQVDYPVPIDPDGDRGHRWSELH
jgi:DNA polymerase-1